MPAADPSDGGVKKKHSAAFGRGIYTCPDYKMAKEDMKTSFEALKIMKKPLKSFKIL